ncbi:hypothetical protein FRC08_010602 [Ceratobasidium sp. 394]|nr:hypothetical protein FRC08_010602 [Ceratobasidium sp. 394]
MATEAPLILSPSYQPHRPNSLLIPPNPAFAPTSPRGGILMNAARLTSPMSASSSMSGLWPGTYTPRSPSPLSASLTPDSAPVDRSASLGSRKIRFAPLPEPRRDVMVDEDGAELPCSSSYPADATSFPVQSPGAGTSITLDRTDSLMTDSGASTASTETDTQSQVARKKEKRNSLLRIFGMKGSSSKRTSTASLPTADSNGTIGGIPVPGLGLFRPSSRESWSGELSGYTSDNSVSRRMSSPLRPEFSSRSHPATPNYGSFGAPMMQTTSDGSGSVQRPQRMLNGRVYGAKRAKERLQPQPSMEPEFSEWGYGGMGSVGSSGEYGKLQSSSSAVGGGDDDDDGSGMTWIRKRREKREREEREKKAAEEAAAAEAANKAAEEPTESSAEPRASTETTKSTPTIHAEPAETVTEPKTPTRDTHSPTMASPGPSQPPSRTNSTPLSPPRTQATRNVPHPPSRQDSGATVTPERHVSTVITVPAHRGRPDTVLGNSVAMSPETSPERSSGSSRRSSSSDDEDAEGSSSTTGRDEEEDEEEEVSDHLI